MNFSKEQFLQRVTSEFQQRETSAMSFEQIFEQVTSVFTTSDEQRVNFNE